MADALLEDSGAGDWKLIGELGVGTVSRLLKTTDICSGDSATIRVDLSGVTRSDSAGLALLVEWLREAERRYKAITFVNMPAQMQSIARVCGLDEMLSCSSA